ncbi:MAG: UDP-N-acetylmuramate:L-alanyl-gamma-D-glutamyl-meso-diaminopimelate ligase [Candidatus Hydrogenedentota bacterium]
MDFNHATHRGHHESGDESGPREAIGENTNVEVLGIVAGYNARPVGRALAGTKGDGMLLVGELNRRPRAHFSGIGGTAMVAGARLALEADWEVRGSDNPLYPPTSEMVRALGVPVYEGYAASNLDWGPDVVVVGNVLSRGNPEVEAMLERRLHYVSFPEWVKDAVLRARRPVVVCGTHGKTTTTALTAYLLDCAGLRPGFLIGGQPLDFPHSARLGVEDGPFVIEGDEYDSAFFDKRAKFFHYLPDTAVVTSIEFDHGDIYRDIEEIELAFQRMLRQIPAGGRLLLCADSARAFQLRRCAHCRTETYGFATESDWMGVMGDTDEKGRALLTVYRDQTEWGRFRAPLAGRHNLQNALAAIAVAARHGVSARTVGDALPEFKGVRRRMEVFLEAGGVTFVDDFAHHPTAIRETISAARARWPKRRLRVLFEPRSNTTVTNAFRHDLYDAFRGADEVWLGPIHRAESIPEERRLDRVGLVKELRKARVDAFAAHSVDEIVSGVAAGSESGDVVLILSNGAFGGIYEKFRSVFHAANRVPGP